MNIRGLGRYQDTDKIRVTATHVKLEAIATSKRRNRQRLNWIRLAENGRIPIGVKYAQPRITFDGLNWWFSVAVEFEPEEKPELSGKVIGIDAIGEKITPTAKVNFAQIRDE